MSGVWLSPNFTYIPGNHILLWDNDQLKFRIGLTQESFS